MGVYVSSILNEVIKTISIFSRNFCNMKTHHKEKPANKKKRTKNNKGNSFSSTKISKRGKNVYSIYFFLLKIFFFLKLTLS